MLRWFAILCFFAGASAFMAPSALPLRTSRRNARVALMATMHTDRADEAGTLCASVAACRDVIHWTEHQRTAVRMQRRPALQSALAAMLALPAAARAKVTTPADLAMMAPGEVVQTLLDALAKNDLPEPNTGLNSLIASSSPSNPAVRDPARFIDVIKKSGYSILLGGYESMKMAKPEEGVLKNGNYGATVAVKLVAPARNFAAAGVDKKFLFAEEEAAKETDSANAGDQDSKLFCVVQFQLSKDAATKAFLVDTVFLVPFEMMRA